MDRGGRPKGIPGSRPTSVTRPVKPSSRSVTAALPPASPPPTITIGRSSRLACGGCTGSDSTHCQASTDHWPRSRARRPCSMARLPRRQNRILVGERDDAHRPRGHTPVGGSEAAHLRNGAVDADGRWPTPSGTGLASLGGWYEFSSSFVEGPTLFGQGVKMQVRKLEVRSSPGGSGDGAGGDD